MHRRDLLVLGASAIGTIAGRRVLAQQQINRAAVVIGVDKAGDFPVLNAAASGARQFADWLTAQDFEVKSFIDDAGAVSVHPIKEAVRELVNRGTIQQLIVYFSGHGCLIGFNEFWLLSGAPSDTGEAISFGQCYDVAQQTSIQNIVFISDACRSTVDSLEAQHLTGSQIFPNLSGVANVDVKIDKFFASRPGQSAFEVPVGTSAPQYKGIYTSVFLDAFAKPDENMVVEIDGKRVVPNRKLESYLRREVPLRAEAASITLFQRPQTDVVSDDSWYIGRAAAAANPAVPPEATESDVVGYSLSKIGIELSAFQPEMVATVSQVTELASEIGLSQAKSTILAAGQQTDFSIHTGFAVSGAIVESVRTEVGVTADTFSNGNKTLVRVELGGRPAASVALRFTDGSGTVLACLNHFVGNVVVDKGLISTVNFDYEGFPPDDLVRSLRATVAAAAQLGSFRIQGQGKTRTDQARDLGNTIRMGKGADPTLGLYAAYAYNEAALVEDVGSVADVMQDNIQTQLFDVAMLAGLLKEGVNLGEVVPFCPMLSQGWDLLGARGIQLPGGMQRARGYLRPALWTTFSPEGMSIVLESGNLGTTP